MTTKVVTTQVAANTSTGTQDITVPGLGAASEIKGYIIKATRATSDDTLTDNRMLSVGFSDGTNSRVSVHHSETAQSTTDTARRHEDDGAVIFILTANGDSVEGEASHSAFITDGIQINWTFAIDTAMLLHVTIFVANACTVGHFRQPAAEDASVTVTTGHPNDLVFVYEPFSDSSGFTGVNQHWGLGGFGWAVDQVGFPQGNVVMVAAHGQADGDPRVMIDNTRIVTLTTFTCEVTDMTSTAFEITIRDGPSDEHDPFYMALDLGDVGAQCGDNTQPTGTGNQDNTGPGFRPQFVMELSSLVTGAFGTEYVDSSAGCVAVGTFDDTRSHVSGYTDEDGTTTSKCDSYASSSAVRLYDDSGALEAVASFDSFLSNGYRLNYSDAASATYKRLWLAIEAVIVAVAMSTAYGSTDALAFPLELIGAYGSSGSGDLTRAYG